MSELTETPCIVALSDIVFSPGLAMKQMPDGRYLVYRQIGTDRIRQLEVERDAAYRRGLEDAAKATARIVRDVCLRHWASGRNLTTEEANTEVAEAAAAILALATRKG